MTTLYIILGLAAPILILLLAGRLIRKLTMSPAQVAQARMEEIVRSIPDAKAFHATLAAQDRVTPDTAESPQDIYVVRREGADTKGFPHRCAYCGNPLYITDTACSGCGAPRA